VMIPVGWVGIGRCNRNQAMMVVYRSGIDWRYEELLGTGCDFSYMLLYPDCHERLVLSRVGLASIERC
jgi:hypothetical protein